MLFFFPVCVCVCVNHLKIYIKKKKFLCPKKKIVPTSIYPYFFGHDMGRRHILFGLGLVIWVAFLSVVLVPCFQVWPRSMDVKPPIIKYLILR